MKTYALYVTHKSETHFVQKGFSPEDLMKPRSTIQRWISQMGIEIVDAKNTKLEIYENDGVILATKYGGAKLTWKKPVEELPE